MSKASDVLSKAWRPNNFFKRKGQRKKKEDSETKNKKGKGQWQDICKSKSIFKSMKVADVAR